MKKLTLLVLAIGLVFGAFAQGFQVGNKTVNEKNHFKSVTLTSKVVSSNQIKPLNIKTPGFTVSTPVCVETDSGFNATFTITPNIDAQKYQIAVFEGGTFADFGADAILNQYFRAYDTLLQQYGLTYFDTITVATELTYVKLTGNTSYDIVTCAIDTTNGDTVVNGVSFTTPSSALAGNASLTVIKTEHPDDGDIEWTVTPNNQTRQYWFVCEPADTANALYWLNNGQASTEEESAMMDLEYWATSSDYTDMFIFTQADDVNETFATNAFVEDDLYAQGTEYVYAARPFNGNNEAGDDICVFFTYGGSGLNDVAAFATMSVYPNPTTNNVTLSSKYNLNKIELINSLGQVVYSSNVNSNVVNVPTSNLEKGTYFVRAYAEGMMAAKKVVVR